MHKIRVSLAMGLNCPVSMELIVLTDTLTIFAKASSLFIKVSSLSAKFCYQSFLQSLLVKIVCINQI